MLVFPSRDSSLGPGRALGFDRTILAGVGPVAPQHLVGFFVCIVIRQPLPGRTTIGVIRDAYMVAGGIPEAKSGHAHAVADMALGMIGAVAETGKQFGETLQARIAIHSGEVV